MNLLQANSPFSSGDYWLAVLAIVVGVLFISYQLLSWFNWKLIAKFSIWWNNNVWKRHEEPYEGPSETIKKVSHIYGIVVFLLGIIFIAFGVMIFVVANQ